MIKLFSGRLGQGKTLSMINDASRFVRAGGRVFTNTPFFVPNSKNQPIYCATSAELTQKIFSEKECLFCIDELAILMPAYDWKNFNNEWREFLFQSRKMGVHIFATTQRFRFAIVQLRELTDFVVECRKLLGGKVFVNKIYDAEAYMYDKLTDAEMKKFLIKKRIILPHQSAKLKVRYDTLHIVGGNLLTNKDTKANIKDRTKSALYYNEEKYLL